MDELEQTVGDAARGVPAAVDVLLEQNLPQLRAFVRLRMGPELRARESASDIVQSACREVLGHLDRYRYQGPAQFRHWLFTTAQRKISNKLSYHRAAKRDVRRDVAPSPSRDADLEPCYATVSPSRYAMGKERVEQLELAFDRLEPEQREVITLARIVGLSHREIAAVLGKSEGACRTLLYRATAHLGVLLD